MTRVAFPLLLAATIASAACSTGSSSSFSNPLAASSTQITETFTGTVDVNGIDTHAFTETLAGGQIAITLTAAGPPATIYMGLSIGSSSAGTCAPLSGGQVIVQAGATAQLSGSAGAGTYCVQVYDAGNQIAQVSYAVTVTHY